MEKAQAASSPEAAHCSIVQNKPAIAFPVLAHWSMIWGHAAPTEPPNITHSHSHLLPFGHMDKY